MKTNGYHRKDDTRDVLFIGPKSWHGRLLQYCNKYTLRFLEEANTTIFDYDVIIPLTIESSEFIARAQKTTDKTSCVVPGLAQLELCNNKVKFSQFLIDNGLGQHVALIADLHDYPYIVKPASTHFGRGSKVIHSADDFDFSADSGFFENYLVQRAISGTNEYSAYFYRTNEGVLFSLYQHYTFEEEFTIKGVGGQPHIRKLLPAPNDHGLFEKILAILDYRGICCFDYKMDGDKVIILELNPRFGGGLSYYIDDFLMVYTRKIP